MKKPPRARVSALVEKNGKYLLVKEFIRARDGIYWLAPGGGVKYGEKMEDVLKREVMEETGIKIKVGRFFSIKDWIVSNQAHSICIYFLAKAVGGELRKERESYGAEFYTVSEMKQLKITPFTKQLFTKLEKETKG